MRALEYAALTLIVGALAYAGAVMIGNAIGASLNATAAQIESAGR